MLCGACAGPTALRGGRPRQRRWPPTARRWCGRGRSVASTTSPRGGGRSTAGSSSTSSRSAGRSRRASRPRTTRCLLSPYRGDCGCAASAGHLSLSLPLSLCVCVLCACRCVNLCALHLAGRCQAPFLAWIGSPCLRDCVHGASITCRTCPLRRPGRRHGRSRRRLGSTCARSHPSAGSHATPFLLLLGRVICPCARSGAAARVAQP
jgi:hypothetical protein